LADCDIILGYRMQKIRPFGISLMLCLLIISEALGQITDNHFEVRVKNDNAGEISNWLHTGDDLGETHSLRLSAHLLKKHTLYNFRIILESTEYSALNVETAEPRDILFTELNSLQIAIDNNKFGDQSFFFSGAGGLYYIQGNKLTIGAAGQKYYMHKWVISKLYPKRYWIYDRSPVRDIFVPYVELKYGYNQLLFKTAHSSLFTVNNLESRVAGKFHFSGIGARTYFDLKLSVERFNIQDVDVELEGLYLTNITQYQTAYLQIGTRVNFEHVAVYTQINQPIKKYLDNPLIKYDDMELQFNYGFLFVF